MKRYLKTIEEIAKALQDEKVVYINNDDNQFKLINGIVFGFNGKITINPSIPFEPNHTYTYDIEPLKLEVGKFYKKRDGKKEIHSFFDDKRPKTCPLQEIKDENMALSKQEKNIFLEGLSCKNCTEKMRCKEQKDANRKLLDYFFTTITEAKCFDERFIQEFKNAIPSITRRDVAYEKLLKKLKE